MNKKIVLLLIIMLAVVKFSFANENSAKFTFQNPEPKITFMAGDDSGKSSNEYYRKFRLHLGAGIGMAVSGFVAFNLLGPILIGVGVYNIVYETRTWNGYRYIIKQPYKDGGIAATVLGGIFFLSGMGVMIAGFVNLGVAGFYYAKYRQDIKKVSFDLNYDYEKSNLGLIVNVKI